MYPFSVKKAQEFAMCNEQNGPHEPEKRSDYSELEAESTDLTGEVKANKPIDKQEDDDRWDDTDGPESADKDSEVAGNEPLSTEENTDNPVENDENDLNSEEIVDEEAPEDVSTELEERSKTEESNFPDVEGRPSHFTNVY